jgi:hypothetical protein
VEPQTDLNAAGLAEAFQYTAAASGTVNALYVYLDPGSAASQVALGLYADAANSPAALLAQGTLASPAAGAWNAVAVAPVAVTAGARYWVAVLAPVAVATGGALASLRGRRLVPVAALAAVALLGFYTFHDLRYIHSFHLGSDEAGLTDARWSALRTFLHAHDAQFPAIASDGHTLSALDVIYRYAPSGGKVLWHGRAVVSHRWHPRPRDVGGATLLWSRHTSAPPQPRWGWRLAWSSDNGALRIYRPAAVG